MINQSILIQKTSLVPHPSAEQWLQQAARALPQEAAQQEARALLLGVLGRPLTWLYLHGSAPLPARALPALEQALQQRRQGVPLAYILGKKAFWDMELMVNAAVLCPRPETELLVEACLEKIAPLPSPTIADLGTGSGAIALALARERTDAQLLATDTSPEALSVAKHNACQWAAGVELVQTRWLEGLNGPFDAIVSNPPYIEPGNPWLDSDGTRHEPRAALVAGAHGLADLFSIIEQAPARLKPGGWLLLEHGHDQSAAVQAAMKKAGFQSLETRPDLAGLDRISLGRKTRE